MEHIKKGLLILGILSISFGVLGTLGSIDFGRIDMKQALIQCLVCVGVGIACFVGRWVLCLVSHNKP